MSQELRQELTDMIGPAAWHWLKPHAERGALWLVDAQMDLAEVGVAIANDNVQMVQRWLGEQLISKPTPEQMAQWDSEGGHRFNSLIIQPFVLMHLN
jgi:hypothetical protein